MTKLLRHREIPTVLIAIMLACSAAAFAFNVPAAHNGAHLAASTTYQRSPPLVMEKGREADDVSGAVANTFGDIFANMFKPSAEKQAEIDRAYAEQLEVAARRKNPAAYKKRLAETEARRRKESEAFQEKFAWQKGDNPLQEFLKRKKEGKIAPIGYEDEPKGGIPLPSASFGVGGEFGVGGKFDNGMRFDLRLPFAEQGWVDESELEPLTKGKGGKGKAGKKGQQSKAQEEDDDEPWYAKIFK